MRKTLIVRVSEEDIEKGKRGNMWACPIACALKRAGYVNQQRPIVRRLVDLGSAGLYSHSRASMQFAKDFDSGRSVKPSTFRLRRSEEKWD